MSSYSRGAKPSRFASNTLAILLAAGAIFALVATAGSTAEARRQGPSDRQAIAAKLTAFLETQKFCYFDGEPGYLNTGSQPRTSPQVLYTLGRLAKEGRHQEFRSVFTKARLQDCFQCAKHREWHTKHAHCTMDCGGNNGIFKGPCFEGCKAGMDVTRWVRGGIEKLKGIIKGIAKAVQTAVRPRPRPIMRPRPVARPRPSARPRPAAQRPAKALSKAEVARRLTGFLSERKWCMADYEPGYRAVGGQPRGGPGFPPNGSWKIMENLAKQGEGAKFLQLWGQWAMKDCFQCAKHREWHTKHAHCTMDCGGNNGIFKGPCFETCKAGFDISRWVRSGVQKLRELIGGIGKAIQTAVRPRPRPIMRPRPVARPRPRPVARPRPSARPRPAAQRPAKALSKAEMARRLTGFLSERKWCMADYEPGYRAVGGQPRGGPGFPPNGSWKIMENLAKQGEGAKFLQLWGQWAMKDCFQCAKHREWHTKHAHCTMDCGGNNGIFKGPCFETCKAGFDISRWVRSGVQKLRELIGGIGKAIQTAVRPRPRPIRRPRPVARPRPSARPRPAAQRPATALSKAEVARRLTGFLSERKWCMADYEPGYRAVGGQPRGGPGFPPNGSWKIMENLAKQGEGAKFLQLWGQWAMKDCFQCAKHREWHTKHAHCTMDCGGNNGIFKGPCFETCKAGFDISRWVRSGVQKLRELIGGIGKAIQTAVRR